jgi:hypothetical protein
MLAQEFARGRPPRKNMHAKHRWQRFEDKIKESQQSTAVDNEVKE